MLHVEYGITELGEEGSMTAYPPEILRPDPIALGEGPAGTGNGPVVIVQNSPATGDIITRNSEGYWVNGSLATVLGSPGVTAAVSKPTVVSGEPIQDVTGVWSTWYVVTATAGKINVSIGSSKAIAEAKTNEIIPAATTLAVNVEEFRLPPKWWVLVEVTTATISEVRVVEG